MAISGDRELRDVSANVFGAIRSEFPAANEATKGMQDLDVDQM